MLTICEEKRTILMCVKRCTEAYHLSDAGQ